jgi:IS1 family transposase
LSGLILCGRVGKHTDALAIELVSSTQGKTDCKEWGTDGWGAYERALCSDEIEHYISKALTQRIERTNGVLRQQTGRWHRRQNKFSKLWEQTKLSVRLCITYFNWIWRHSCLGTTDRAVRKCGAARLKHCVVDLRQCNEMLSVRP